MCTVRKLFGILFLVCAVPQAGVGQNQTESEVLTNSDVVEMINAACQARLSLPGLSPAGVSLRLQVAHLLLSFDPVFLKKSFTPW